MVCALPQSCWQCLRTIWGRDLWRESGPVFWCSGLSLPTQLGPVTEAYASSPVILSPGIPFYSQQRLTWSSEAQRPCVHTQGHVLISIPLSSVRLMQRHHNAVEGVCAAHVFVQIICFHVFNLSLLVCPRVCFAILLWLLLNIKNYSFIVASNVLSLLALSESCPFPAYSRRSVERLLLAPTGPLHTFIASFTAQTGV